MAASQRKDTLLMIQGNRILNLEKGIIQRDEKIVRLEEGFTLLEKKKDAECLSVKSQKEVTDDKLKQMTKSRNFWRFIAVAIPAAIVGTATYLIVK